MSIGTPAPHLPPPVPPSPPAVVSHRSRWRRWLPVTVVGASVVAVAVVVVTSSAIGEVETIQPTAEVTAVEIDIEAGTVRLASGDELHVGVVRHAGRLAGTPVVTTETTSGVLRVLGRCAGLGVGRCETSIAVTLPPSTAVDLVTGAGSIHGTIPQGGVRARTAAGSITLAATEQTSDIVVTTAVGSIDLVVPDVIYDVTAHTEVGRTDIEVETDADASRSIQARADVGSISIRTPE
jgi:hypothetical protein